MQLDDQGILQPIAFYSRQMLYDKELLVIVSCFRHWRHFLQGARFTTSVLTDHLNLKYFQSAKQLTRRQAIWSLFLSEFQFIISSKPGKLNGRPDSLSRDQITL